MLAIVNLRSSMITNSNKFCPKTTAQRIKLPHKLRNATIITWTILDSISITGTTTVRTPIPIMTIWELASNHLLSFRRVPSRETTRKLIITITTNRISIAISHTPIKNTHFIKITIPIRKGGRWAQILRNRLWKWPKATLAMQDTNTMIKNSIWMWISIHLPVWCKAQLKMVKNWCKIMGSRTCSSRHHGTRGRSALHRTCPTSNSSSWQSVHLPGVTLTATQMRRGSPPCSPMANPIIKMLTFKILTKNHCIIRMRSIKPINYRMTTRSLN